MPNRQWNFIDRKNEPLDFAGLLARFGKETKYYDYAALQSLFANREVSDEPGALPEFRAQIDYLAAEKSAASYFSKEPFFKEYEPSHRLHMLALQLHQPSLCANSMNRAKSIAQALEMLPTEDRKAFTNKRYRENSSQLLDNPTMDSLVEELDGIFLYERLLTQPSCIDKIKEEFSEESYNAVLDSVVKRKNFYSILFKTVIESLGNAIKRESNGLELRKKYAQCTLGNCVRKVDKNGGLLDRLLAIVKWMLEWIPNRLWLAFSYPAEETNMERKQGQISVLMQGPSARLALELAQEITKQKPELYSADDMITVHLEKDITTYPISIDRGENKLAKKVELSDDELREYFKVVEEDSKKRVKHVNKNARDGNSYTEYNARNFLYVLGYTADDMRSLAGRGIISKDIKGDPIMGALVRSGRGINICSHIHCPIPRKLQDDAHDFIQLQYPCIYDGKPSSIGQYGYYRHPTTLDAKMRLVMNHPQIAQNKLIGLITDMQYFGFTFDFSKEDFITPELWRQLPRENKRPETEHDTYVPGEGVYDGHMRLRLTRVAKSVREESASLMKSLMQKIQTQNIASDMAIESLKYNYIAATVVRQTLESAIFNVKNTSNNSAIEFWEGELVEYNWLDGQFAEMFKLIRIQGTEIMKEFREEMIGASDSKIATVLSEPDESLALSQGKPHRKVNEDRQTSNTVVSETSNEPVVCTQIQTPSIDTK